MANAFPFANICFAYLQFANLNLYVAMNRRRPSHRLLATDREESECAHSFEIKWISVSDVSKCIFASTKIKVYLFVFVCNVHSERAHCNSGNVSAISKCMRVKIGVHGAGTRGTCKRISDRIESIPGTQNIRKWQIKTGRFRGTWGYWSPFVFSYRITPDLVRR